MQKDQLDVAEFSCVLLALVTKDQSYNSCFCVLVSEIVPMPTSLLVISYVNKFIDVYMLFCLLGLQYGKE